MSILAAAGDEPITAASIMLALMTVGFGTVIAAVLGFFRRGSVVGPPRGERSEAPGVLLVLAAGLVVWFGAQIVYGSVRAAQHRASGSTEPFTTAVLGAADYAFLSTIPFILALLVVAVGDRLAAPTLPRELGWSLGQLRGGLWRGGLAALSIVPLVMGGSIFLTMLYRAIGYEHPTAHEMLKVLGESRDPVIRVTLIIGATLLAPVFEEFLFRGHLQTLLVHAFSPRPQPAPRREVYGFEPLVPGAPRLEPPPPPAPPEPPPAPSARVRWAAIFLASLAFAALHPVWTWPLIFVLSIGMGYAYERTGNLWVPVVIHLLFNTFNTVYMLLSQRFEPLPQPL
ncbi:MAG TPA: type II CAAX endopeptidase family protein [Tepidisphaeraceae bacterium]|nr:type II CAAX endopeptidase family protein [Tepidisphaeraceae bacterium]